MYRFGIEFSAFPLSLLLGAGSEKERESLGWLDRVWSRIGIVHVEGNAWGFCC